MGKSFTEVLPGIVLPDDVKDLLKYISVERVCHNRTSDLITMYLSLNRLIPKKVINRLEQEVKNQFFGSNKTEISIREDYRLPDNYTPEFVMEHYRDSLEMELKDYNHVVYSLLHDAKISYPEEEILHCDIPDSMIARARAEELERILHKVFNERFHLTVDVQMAYVDAKKNVREEKASFIEDEIRRTLEEVERRHQEEEEKKAQQETKKKKAGDEFLSGKPEKPDKAEKKTASKEPADKKQAASKDKPDKGKGKSDQFKKPFNKSEGFKRTPTSPDMIYGRSFEGESIPLSEIIGEMGEVIVSGEIMTIEFRTTKSGSTLGIFTIFDQTDSIGVKLFLRAEGAEEVKEKLKPGLYIQLKGVSANDPFDNEISISSVRGIKKATAPEKKKRMDNAPRKRVELHCHTKFSDMDAVADVGELMKTVYSWNMPALAITDHGNVQAFTEAFHKMDKKGHPDFKMIYGMEGYLIDDLIQVAENSDGRRLRDSFVVFDLETTGLNNDKHKIIEIGAVRVKNLEVVEKYHTFVNPHEPLSLEIEELTNVHDSMLKDAPGVEEALPAFLDWVGDDAFIGHNVAFDINFILKKAEEIGYEMKKPCYADTMRMARYFSPGKKATLDAVAKDLDIRLDDHHRADADTDCTVSIFLKFAQMFEERGIDNLDQLNELTKPSAEMIQKNPTYYHIILIAKNDIGRVNLYRLVSESHLKYFARKPRIPKSLLIENREGLIIGAACERGELFRAVLDGADHDRIAQLCEFYDYFEIQPIGNNRFMIGKSGLGINSDEDLQELNRKIYQLGKTFHKPVCATCDSHFMKPEDAIYRAIIQAGQHYTDADNQPPLYFRTTEEMLEEFRYLGDDIAEEIVIDNTNMIADMCEPIEPVRPDKCPPVIENSDRDLRDMCYEKAHSIYGEDLPEIVVERLERELNSIISNGFAVMYIIAQKLVWKSNSDGYLVGSRGSVGSSFVATMSGITEVNPLSPHYYCSNCHYYDFDSEEVKQFVGMAGCDMPDKVCPVCGQPLKKEGFDIPFETFLGFKGDKEPDIDLNFSGEYQSKAHDYTEVIFGKGHTFRAGTISSLADKTSYGFVKKYYAERNMPKRRCEMERIAVGCTGVKRGTGQHPGGIIVMPHGEEIYSFTPVQHPANDMTTKTITTHFDYHSIDHNLLKLDILGHDDPTMIRMLEDLIGIDAKMIPLDDHKVMSLFQSTEALGIMPEDIDGCPLGTLGVPEFGTDFAMQMLIDTKPKYLSDLIRIAGLAHGTDVWLGNAQDLILSGQCTIQTAICCRDDIMIYLISMGCDKERSFKLMEKVRKGKGLTPEEQDYMRENNVPEWYIQSCLKIKYMFPKAHAAAYVMMAWRIAYCKVYYPLEYYTAFFSIRADGFSYEKMCLGREVLDRHIKSLRETDAKKTATENVQLKDLRIVQEFYARGYEFVKIDLYKAKANRFQIIDGKIMPSFASIDGLGATAAQSLEDAAREGQFLSKDDLMARGKVSSTHVATMVRLGIIGDELPDSNQLDFMSMLTLME